MDVAAVFDRLLDRQIDSLYRAARALPPERLAWSPAAGVRTVLDMLQEVATAPDRFWPVYETGMSEWRPDDFADWMAERAKLTELDELEARTRAGFRRVAEFIRAQSPERLAERVVMPFPGEFTLLDVLAYHYWNASYHEGQIWQLKALAEAEVKGVRG